MKRKGELDENEDKGSKISKKDEEAAAKADEKILNEVNVPEDDERERSNRKLQEKQEAKNEIGDNTQDIQEKERKEGANLAQLIENIQATNVTYVTNLEELEEMIEHLKKQKVIGFDMEFAREISFAGKVCLLQISSQERNFILDTLYVGAHTKLLQDIFKDSAVLKIGHGCVNDILYLAKDFEIKISNLFDTSIASQELKLKRNSLEYLFKHYIEVNCEKHLAKSNWSQRPLSPAMLNYACNDTCHLIKIYRKMKDELGNDQIVRKRSKTLTEKVYVAPRCKDALSKKLGKKAGLSEEQQRVLQNLLIWRFSKARENDIYPLNIVGNEELVKISETMPGTEEKLFECFPEGICEIIEENAVEILEIVKKK